MVPFEHGQGQGRVWVVCGAIHGDVVHLCDWVESAGDYVHLPAGRVRKSREPGESIDLPQCVAQDAHPDAVPLAQKGLRPAIPRHLLLRAVARRSRHQPVRPDLQQEDRGQPVRATARLPLGLGPDLRGLQVPPGWRHRLDGTAQQPAQLPVDPHPAVHDARDRGRAVSPPAQPFAALASEPQDG
uniref:(northern house mosquito) hypothetical protein n=1 Tax=Culex pipiens TaxID=7175 RepID=A0A8D8CU17_CULPI